MQEVGCNTIKAEGDADVLIMKTAIKSAAERPTVLVGDNLIVLLCYFTQPDGYDLCFRLESKGNSRQSEVWNMKQVKAELGHQYATTCCFIMLFLAATQPYALTGLEKPRPLRSTLTLLPPRPSEGVRRRLNSR